MTNYKFLGLLQEDPLWNVEGRAVIVAVVPYTLYTQTHTHMLSPLILGKIDPHTHRHRWPKSHSPREL
jgi:hypothetical protein